MCEPTPMYIYVLCVCAPCPPPYTVFCSSNSLKVIDKCVAIHLGGLLLYVHNICNDNCIVYYHRMSINIECDYLKTNS